MPDSVRIKEIHAALDAQKFASDPTNPQVNRTANLGYYIERIGRVLGISVNTDGTIRSIRQAEPIAQLPNTTTAIPAGWYYGQWGLNNGGNTQGQQGGSPTEERDGMVYQTIANKMQPGIKGATSDSVVAGDLVLVENIPQLLAIMLRDLDKVLGGQELGAWVLPNADSSKTPCEFEGLSSMIFELLFMVSRLSQHTSQTHLASLINQGILNELLRATGQPLDPKVFKVDIGDATPVSVPFLGLAPDAPSQVTQTAWIMENLSMLVAKQLKIL